MLKEDIAIMQRIDLVVWNELVAVLTAHPEESLHDPTSPKWTSRDVFAHMARWLERNNNFIETFCSTGTFPVSADSTEALNALWQQEDKVMPLKEAKEKALAEFSRRQRIIAAIPEDKWNEKLMQIVRYDGATHYAAHLNYIVVA